MYVHCAFRDVINYIIYTVTVEYYNNVYRKTALGKKDICTTITCRFDYKNEKKIGIIRTYT